MRVRTATVAYQTGYSGVRGVADVSVSAAPWEKENGKTGMLVLVGKGSAGQLAAKDHGSGRPEVLGGPSGRKDHGRKNADHGRSVCDGSGKAGETDARPCAASKAIQSTAAIAEDVLQEGYDLDKLEDEL